VEGCEKLGGIVKQILIPSDDVRRFILTSVPSVPFLEGVLLLRTDSSAVWDVHTVASRLYLSEQKAAEILDLLCAAGIAQPSAEIPETPEKGFRYAPAPELGAMLDQVARVYAVALVAVTDLIHSRLDKRAQQFADAFRWRKDS
jgi:hypothetical protein